MDTQWVHLLLRSRVMQILGMAAALGLLGAGCSDEDTRVLLLNIEGWPAAQVAKELRLQPFLNGRHTLKVEKFDGQPPQVALRWPKQTEGVVSVYAEGVSTTDCVVFRGEVDARLGPEDMTSATLTLHALQTPLCECSRSGWCWEYPAKAAHTIHDVFGIGTSLWAVGSRGSILSSTDSGATWQPMASPTQATLFGVWGTSARDLWAVGASESETTPGNTILHYDGEWKRASGIDALPIKYWYGIWGARSNDIWIVGAGGYAAHFTESKGWQPVPASSSRAIDLTGIAGRSPDDIWAVGGVFEKDGLKRCGTDSAIVHWDGSRWSDIEVPPSTPPLRQVAVVSAGKAWAVGGSYDCSNRPQGTALGLSWDRASGRVDITPNSSAAVVTTPWSDIWSDRSTGTVWLVGGDVNASRAAILSGTGSVLTAPAAKISRADEVFLRAAWGVNEGVVAAGDFGHIFQISGSSVRSTGESSGGLVVALGAVSPDQVWAVGIREAGKGLLLRWDGLSWSDATSMTGPVAPLLAVQGSHANRVFMAGENDGLYLWNGTGLQRCPLPPSKALRTLRGIWIKQQEGLSGDEGCDSDADDLWLVGGDESARQPGVILHKTGRSWETLFPVDEPMAGRVFYDVWGAGDTGSPDAPIVFVVGGQPLGPVVLRCAGSVCKEEPFAENDSWILGIWGSQESDVYAVTGNVSLRVGNVYHRSGSVWARESNQTATTLPVDGMSGVWGSGRDDVYAVGGRFMPNQSFSGQMAGYIQTKRSGAWKTEDSGTTNNLRAVTGGRLGNVWAAGEGPVILRKRLLVP